MISIEHAKLFCKDYIEIENYEEAVNDTTQIWDCHHRLETHNSDGERRFVDLSRAELLTLDMYYHRPSEELIFMTHSEHHLLHNKGKTPWNKGYKGMPGHKHSEETKQRMSENNSRYWKGKTLSEETKMKMSESHKGRHWYNNGIENAFTFECPEGFVPGMLQKC